MKPLDRKTCNRTVATTVAMLCIFVSSVSAPAAQADDLIDSLRRTGDVTFDVVILRPFWGLTLVTGCALLAPAVLFASPGGIEAIRDAKEVFFDGPYKQTVERPLGEF